MYLQLCEMVLSSPFLKMRKLRAREIQQLAHYNNKNIAVLGFESI